MSQVLVNRIYAVSMKRTATEAAQTREALLQAALQSFGEVGWKASTFESIAERAGVTRGALNHHFRSKRALLTEALNWGWFDYGAHLFSPELGKESGEEFLASLFRTYIALLRSDEQFRSLASTTVLTAPQAFEATDAKSNGLNAWRETIVDALKRDEKSSLDAETIAGLTIAVLQGLTLSAVISPKDLPDSIDIDIAAQALAKGLLH